MELSKLEIGKNYEVINVYDLNDLNINSLNSDHRLLNLKLETHIESLEMLEQFKTSKILETANLHIKLSFTKQIFLLLNTAEILKNCIIKSVNVVDAIIVLEIFIVSEVTNFIYKNNIKILDRLNYITNDIQIHSKNHEILYQANFILKELQKSDNTIKNIKSRIDKLSEYINSK